MQERVAQFGGKLRITSSPGTGTTLTIDLPIEAHGRGQRIESDHLESAYLESKYENPNLAGG